MDRLKGVDFFCGAGGMTKGLKDAGIDVLAGIDIDASCGETYSKNNGAKFLAKDIKTFTPEELESILKIKRGDDSLLFVACSPCQYWTDINTDRGNNECTKNLINDFERFVEYFLPGYILLENVKKFRSSGEDIIDRFKNKIKTLGYVYCDDVARTVQFGVPQTRKRYTLIASRVDLKISLPIGIINKKLTVRNTIGDLNKIEPGKANNSDYLHVSANLRGISIRRLEKTPIDGGTRKSWSPDDELQIDAYRHTDGFYDVYGRMWWDRPAPTITTKFYSISNGRFGHPEQNRAISLREGARLQTFPDDYIFHGTFSSKARQIGNAVPPRYAFHLGKALIHSWRKTTNNQKNP